MPQFILISYTLHIHFIFTSQSLHIHFIFTSYSRHIHVIFTSYSRQIHFIFTSYLCHIHVIFTSYSCHIHVIFTSYSTHSHKIFTFFTRHFPQVRLTKLSGDVNYISPDHLITSSVIMLLGTRHLRHSRVIRNLCSTFCRNEKSWALMVAHNVQIPIGFFHIPNPYMCRKFPVSKNPS